MTRKLDLTGQRYGRLTIIEPAPNHVCVGGQMKTRWVATCDCGSTTVVKTQDLRRGTKPTRSCGCLYAEVPAKLSALNKRSDSGYVAAHMRVYKERGRAADYQCVDCGVQARHWAYNHSDPDELRQPVERKAGRIVDLLYSLDPAHYSPRCQGCHLRLDKAHRDGYQYVTEARTAVAS